MNCCYTDEETDECPNRRLADLPMCQRHMRSTFRLALTDGLLPADVFKVIAAEAVEALGIGMTRRDVLLTNAIADERRARAQAAKAKHESEGVVYYVRLTGDRIKIGWTRDLANRMAIFRARPEDVLAVEPGGPTTEARRHRQFAADRIGRSEEFVQSGQLMAHIARLAERSAMPA